MPEPRRAARSVAAERSSRRLLFTSVAATAFLLHFAGNVQAAPDACAPGAPGSVVCAGDQSDGIVDGVDFDPTLIERLVVRDLTADIAPATGTDGVVFRQEDRDLRIVTEAGDFAIVTGGGADGIVAELESELSVGALLGVVNNLDIRAAGTGIFVSSDTDAQVDHDLVAGQSNLAFQSVAAVADELDPDVDVSDSDPGTQANLENIAQTTVLPSGAGAIEVENSADIEAGGDGIVALSSLAADSELVTSGDQENETFQDVAAMASSSSPAAVSAAVDAVQDYDQVNILQQEIAVEGGADAARIAIANSGSVTAAGDGIVAGSAVLLQNLAGQELHQGNFSQQDGMAEAFADHADASATAAIEQTQDLQQINGGTQQIEGPAWNGAGAVTVDNSGTIQAGGDGIVAASELQAFSLTSQLGLQGDRSVQDAGGVALGDDGEAAVRLDALQDGTTLSTVEQSAVAGGLADAASLNVTNSGQITAGGHGIVAEAGLLTASVGVQILGQSASGEQWGFAVSEAVDGEAASDAELSHRSLRIAAGVQELEGRDGAGVGAVTVDNSGDIVAGGDGIRAGSARLSLAGTAQAAFQNGSSLQYGVPFATPFDEAALDVSQDGDSSSVALQSQRLGTGARAGAVTVANSGRVLAGGDGIVAASQMLLLGGVEQRQEQFGEAYQDAMGLGDVRLDQRQNEASDHYAAQTTRILYGNRTGAVAIDNSGLVAAGGDGLVARSQIMAEAEVFQEVFQENVALQSLTDVAGGNQNQELSQSSVAEQSVLVRLGDRVGAVTVGNSGVVIAEGDGIVAQADVAVGLLAEQFVYQGNTAGQALFGSAAAVQRQSGGQFNAAGQRIRLELGEGVGAVEVDNSGLVVAEGDGIVAESTIDLAAIVERELVQDETRFSEASGSGGAQRSQDVDMENFAEQRVEVTLAASVGAVTVRNSGVVVAEGDGIVAGSRLVLDGDLPASLRSAGGAVAVRSSGTIIAGGTGIRAYSFVETEDGIGPGGDISVRIGEGGLVMGGTGYAVDIDGGGDNRLVNRGTLVSASNRAVRGGDGDERIVNFGTIVGNVDLGGGANHFANRSGALFETGRRVVLGEGGRLANAGTLSPGGDGAIQRTVVQGDLRQRRGSTYLVDIDADGRSDRIAVKGSVTIDEGSTVQVERAAGTYDVGSRYRILTATEGIEGEFDEIEQERLPFLELQLGYRTRFVYLDIGRSGTAFADVARTPNQTAVAQALGSLDRDNALYRAIVWLDEDEAAAAYDSLSGELHATTRSLSGELARRLRTSLLNRIGGAGTGFGRDLQSGNLASLVQPASDADPDAPPAPERPGPQFWMQGYGGTGSQDGDGNAADTNNTAWGSVMGAELLLSDSFGIGLAAGYQNDQLNVDARQSSAEIDSYSVAAYGLWRQGPWRLRGGGAFSWHEFSSRREVAAGGVTGTAKARYSGWSGQAFGELGYRIDLEAVSLEPFAGLTFQHTRTESYRESGAGAANLDVGSDRGSELNSMIGVQAMRSFELENGLQLRPHVSIAWEHRLVGAGAQADLGFVSGGNRFRVSGPTRNRDAAQIGAGLDVVLGEGFEAFGNYDVHLSRSHRDHTARAGIRIRF